MDGFQSLRILEPIKFTIRQTDAVREVEQHLELEKPLLTDVTSQSGLVTRPKIRLHNSKQLCIKMTE